MPALHSFKSNIDFAPLVITSNMFELPWKNINCSTFRMVQNVTCISCQIILFYNKHGQSEVNRLPSALFPVL